MEKIKTINFDEAKTHLATIIMEVEKGHSFIIAKDGKPIAKLVPYVGAPHKRTPGGRWAGKIHMSEDFDTLPKDIEDQFYKH